MPADLQVRLLRVLQDGEYYRVGGQSPMKSNVRIIAATHQNLDDRVKLGLFREDLLHRLNVVRLRLPPLRERREDVPLLMKHFLQKSAQTLGFEAKTLTPAALETVSRFAFPGNVRQLENICHWITVMAPGQLVDIADLPPEVRDQHADTELATTQDTSSISRPLTSAAPLARVEATAAVASAMPSSVSVMSEGAHWRDGLANALTNAIRTNESSPGDRLTREFEETMIRAALAETKGRRIEASVWLGWGRNTLTRKIHELGLDDQV
jgi:two-component system, NtrC family, nitrogen regulation response regulator GlnG